MRINRDLLLVALAMGIWGLGEGMFLIFQPIYLQKLGADPVHIGAILGMAGIAMMVFHIPAGYLADRIGRRPFMWASWFLGLLATCIMALAGSLAWFVAGILLYGTTMFVMAPMSSYVTAARGKWSVGRALTLISAAYNTGAIVGPWLGGLLGERIGMKQVYAISGCILFFSCVTILFIRPQPVERHPDGAQHKGLPLNARYLSYLVIVFVTLFATYLPQPLSPNFLQNQHGLSLGEIGVLGTVCSLGIVVLNLVLGRLEARSGFLISQITVILFAVLMRFGNGMAWFIPAYFLVGGYRITRSMANAQTRSLVHPSSMGLAYGITETVNSATMVLAPPVAGLLYKANPTWMYTFSIGLILISLAAGAIFTPRPVMIKSEQAPVYSE